MSLPVENPHFWQRLDTIVANTRALATARQQGGIGGKLRAFGLLTANVATLARLFCMRVRKNAPRADVRLEPVW